MFTVGHRATEAGEKSRVHRFVDTARAILAADSVILSNSSNIVAFAGRSATSSAARAQVVPIGARATLHHDRSRGVTSATVASDEDDGLSLAVEWPLTPAFEPRIHVALQALARLSSVAVMDSTPSEEHFILAGGRILAELALSAESIEELLGGITAVLGALVDGTSAGVSVLTDRNILQVLPGSFGASSEVVAAAVVGRGESATSTAEVFRTGQTMLSNHPEVEIPRFPEWYECFRVERLITLPMTAGGKRLGVVHIANHPTAFTRTHAQLAERLSPFIASAVAQVRQRLEMRQREKLVVSIGRAAAAIASGRGFDDFAVLVDSFRVVLSCVSTVVTFREDGRRIAVGDGESVEHATGFLAGIDADSSSLRSAMYRPELPGEFGWVSVQVPIVVDGEVRATLALLRTPWLPFQRHERNAIRHMAETIALGWTTDRYLREQSETARMKERLRIADDIHDRVAQLLFAARLSLQNLDERMEAELSKDHVLCAEVQRALDLVEQSNCEVRGVIHHLADSHRSVSVCAELVAIVSEVERQFGIEIRVDLPDGDELPDLGSRAAAVLVSAGREVIINAAKHAGPCVIDVVLAARSPAGVVLRVADDGIGLKDAPPGYGLTSTRRRLTEHAGLMVLRSRPGEGTEVVIEMSARHVN